MLYNYKRVIGQMSVKRGFTVSSIFHTKHAILKVMNCMIVPKCEVIRVYICNSCHEFFAK